MLKENYISAEEAAKLEGLSYTGLISRVARSSEKYKIIRESNAEMGGKERIMVALSSLSPQARRRYRQAQKVNLGELSQDNERPWYVDIDVNWYIEKYKKQYYEAVELCKEIRDFVAYGEREKTAYARETAERLGIGQRTLYRCTENYLGAEAWVLRLEKETGERRDYLLPLSLCRKPRQSCTFPSLSEEQKAFIENVWFDREFAANDGTLEMLYILFERQAKEKGWEGCPSIKTVSRYVRYLMDELRGESARFLQANGVREFRNKKMVKAKRDTRSLAVMEFLQGDAHTFDCWVQTTLPNGKIKAVRPTLVCWIDVRSRCVMGDIMCVHPNSQIIKESFAKAVYSRPGGVPRYILIDNGKDFSSGEMLGQSRKERVCNTDIDGEMKGFYQSLGVEAWTRALPYQGWTKGQIERFFGTVCTGFTKWFSSYVGTLTGSLTSGKKKKPIAQLLEKGELLTMDEFFGLWEKWKNEFYHRKEHGALSREKYKTPMELFENCEQKYFRAPPPREIAAVLLMKGDTARVTQQGINKFNTLYTGGGLEFYIGETVRVKWNADDITKLYVFTMDGKKICEAVSAELLSFAPGVSQEALESHMKRQRAQLKAVREMAEELTTPYEQRQGQRTAGALDIALKAERETVVSLPEKETAREAAALKKGAGKSYFDKKADEALKKLRSLG